MVKKLKGILFNALLGTVAIALTGCGSLTRDTAQTTKRAVTVMSTNDMEYGQYYVMHDTGEKDLDDNKIYEYTTTYVGDANCDTTVSEYKSGRVLWYADDFQDIPTLYNGDRLVYKSSNPPAETYNFERFRYDGVTIGISGIQKRSESNRLYVNVSSEMQGTGMIANGSDAYKLFELQTSIAVIDTIAGVKLETGNVSASGTILGLEQGSLNKNYEAVIYAGSQRYDYLLRADRIALSSMDAFTSHAYSYYAGELVEIQIPDTCNTGYYAVDGQGVFRLVRGSSYSANTEFNTPNGVESDPGEATPSAINTDDVVLETLMIDMDGTYTIAIQLNDDAVSVGAKLVTDTVAYTFTKAEDENVLYATAELKAGTYRIEISGLNGSTYQVNFTQH